MLNTAYLISDKAPEKQNNFDLVNFSIALISSDRMKNTHTIRVFQLKTQWEKKSIFGRRLMSTLFNTVCLLVWYDNASGTLNCHFSKTTSYILVYRFHVLLCILLIKWWKYFAFLWNLNVYLIEGHIWI